MKNIQLNITEQTLQLFDLISDNSEVEYCLGIGSMVPEGLTIITH